MENALNIIVNIATGFAICIPLVYKLIQFVQKANSEKNWTSLLLMVSNYMQEAEELFENGADKKQYVLTAISNVANTINYDVDMEQVGHLIDDLCALSKNVNYPVHNK